MTYTVWYETKTDICMKTLNYGELTNFKKNAKSHNWKIKTIYYVKDGDVVKTVKFN